MNNYPTYKQSFILILSWILFIVIVGVPFVIFGLKIESGLPLLICYTVPLAFAIGRGFSLRKDWSLNFVTNPKILFLVGPALIVCIEFVIEPIIELLPMGETMLELMKDMKDMPVIFFLMAVVAAPVLEEIMFRGIILHGYLKNYKPWTAILVSAFLFGLIHGNLAQGVSAFISGVLFGWIYWKTRSILLVIFLHFINNVLAFFSLLYIPLEYIDKSSRQLIDNDILYACLYLISVGVCIWLLTLMQKKYFQTTASTLATIEESTTTSEN